MSTSPTNIPETILSRKGARTTAAVPADVRQWLDAGAIETVNLCEWLVVDQAALVQTVGQGTSWSHLVSDILAALAGLTTPTTPKRMLAIGRLLAEGLTTAEFDRVVADLREHRSDVVRGWAAFAIGQRPKMTLKQRLQAIRPLAADANMSVREVSWMAVRDALAGDLPQAIPLLVPWCTHREAAVRRFASEVTRPRGVWCRHIASLKDDPSPGLPILEPLRSDPSKYVRDSVSNWLNDASKTCPDWVLQVCQRWEKESPTPETSAIVRRALRTLRKQD